MSYYELDVKNFESVLNAISKFSDGSEAENIINQYLWNEGAKDIAEEIVKLLPESGRQWKGKKTAASKTDPFIQTNSNLAVRIHTKYNYHYLYFPDDGADTDHHYGNQQFMFHGAEGSGDEVATGIINKLLERLEEAT